MIIANYFSAWVGFRVLHDQVRNHVELGLHNAWSILWLMVLVAYLVTLVLELPFIWLEFRKDESRWKKAVLGSLLVQTVSYVLLFGFYSRASWVSLYTQTEIVDPSAIKLPKEVSVYYASRDDGGVYLMSLGDRKKSKVATLHAPKHDELGLLLEAKPGQVNHWDLRETAKQIPFSTLQTDIVAETTASSESHKAGSGRFDIGGDLVRLGSAKQSPWQFYSGYWAAVGLRGENKETHQHSDFAYETPWGQFVVKNCVQLPGDIVLFQLGQNEICVFEVATRRVAVLTKGCLPLAIIPHSETKAVVP
jgi:hypothetical protein